MKYILSRNEWEDIGRLIEDISSIVDNVYVEAYGIQHITGDIKYDNSIRRIVSNIEEAQRKLQELKDLTS